MYFNTFESTIIDDNDEMFYIHIEYDIQKMLLAPDRIFNIETNFDSYLNEGTPKISKGDLDSIVKDLIKSEEGTQIEFI